MNSAALIGIIFLVTTAIISTAVGRWRENHTDDAVAWGRLPGQTRQDQAWESPSDSARSRKPASGRLPDKSRSRNQTQQVSRKNHSAKQKKEYYPPNDTLSFDTGSAPGGAQRGFAKIILIVILIIAAAIAIPPLARSLTNGSSGKRSSRRPKTADARAALSSLENQMRDLFPNVETDSDYADSLGYIVSGRITDDDDSRYRPYVEIAISEEGVITTVEYIATLPDTEDKERAVSDMEADLQTIYDKITRIQGDWASDHLKEYPNLSENIRNGLLSASDPDSDDENIKDSLTYDDGCIMRCEEYNGRFLFLRYIALA